MYDFWFDSFVGLFGCNHPQLFLFPSQESVSSYCPVSPLTKAHLWVVFSCFPVPACPAFPLPRVFFLDILLCQHLSFNKGHCSELRPSGLLHLPDRKEREMQKFSPQINHLQSNWARHWVPLKTEKRHSVTVNARFLTFELWYRAAKAPMNALFYWL